MPTRVIHNADEHDRALKWLNAMKPPFIVSVTKGVKRSAEQNNLAWKWYAEIASQKGDETTEEIHTLCKALFGIPILCRDDAEFREMYDSVVRPHSYEMKLRVISALDVTRLFRTGQFSEYLEAVYRHWIGQGIVLTWPEEMVA